LKKKSTAADKRTLHYFRVSLSLFHRTHTVPEREISSGSEVYCRQTYYPSFLLLPLHSPSGQLSFKAISPPWKCID